MRLDEREAKDIHDENDDNPVVTTETNGDVTRFAYEDGSTGWKLRNGFLADYEQDRYEDIYQMGRRSNE